MVAVLAKQDVALEGRTVAGTAVMLVVALVLVHLSEMELAPPSEASMLMAWLDFLSIGLMNRWDVVLVEATEVELATV